MDTVYSSMDTFYLPWLAHSLALSFCGALLIYLVISRRWAGILNLRLTLYLALAFLSNLALVASYGIWAWDYLGAAFYRAHIYTQAVLPIFLYAVAHAFIHLERRRWFYLPGLALALLLLIADSTQLPLDASGALTPATLVTILRAAIWLTYNSAIVFIGAREYRRASSPLHRNRLAYLALASPFLFAEGALDLWGGESWYSLAAVTQIIGVAILSYATLRHTLVDLRSLIRQTIFFFVLTTFTIVAYALVIGGALVLLGNAEEWQRLAGALIAAMILTFVYQPLRDLVQRGIALAVFGHRYSVEAVVQNFSQKLSARIDLQELAQEGRVLLRQAMGARDAALVLVSRDQEGVALRPIPARPDVPAFRLNADASFIKALSAPRASLLQYDIDRLPRYSDLTAETRAALQRLGGEVYVAVQSRGELIGIWGIGAKTSGDPYTDADRALLATLADQSAVALENARLLADLREQMVQLRSMRDYLDSTMASIATGVLTLDREGKIISLNRAVERIFRVAASDAVGKRYEDVLPILHGAELPLLLARLWSQSAQHLVRDAIAHVAGRGRVHLTIHLSPMRSENEMVGVAVVLEDLTEQARLEMERRAQEQETRRVRDTFEHYVAPTVVQSLLTDPRRIELGGERQRITVMFADMHGFTPLSEQLPPEELVKVLNGYLSLAYQVILRYEGTVDKFMGDGVMAIFNAPLEQPDHAWRAACAALALQHETAEYAARLPGPQRLAFRTGIHTGDAIVGNIGARELMNYTAIGDAVNVAKRLQENAEVGQILISRNTYAMIEQRVVVQPRETLLVKGRAAPVEVLELTGAWEMRFGKQ